MDKADKKPNFKMIMFLYLLGIFMGALDTGIITPARTVIQNALSIDEKTGIWMITIYTLAYAASIPIMGKLADRFGRKYVYLTSILLFGAGSLFCGLSQHFHSFQLLLVSRAVQAIGGGGIVPIATAEFGTTFPKDQRGMALGLVGGVYGIANLFGASAGSAILDLFGKNNWQYIFYVNVPITIFIATVGFVFLANTKVSNVKKIDFGGIILLTIMILSLLYGLRNIDFFNFQETLVSPSVYPFLLVFIALLPFFVLAEKLCEDPIINLSYFSNRRIVITLLLSFISGVVLMGMIFVPQFAENALKIPSGSGGYFVFILALFAGIGAPLSGKLIDGYGAKPVLAFGFLTSIAGSLFLILVTTEHPSLLTVVVSLILTGLGIGFTMGTPINYMMLDNTRNEESNSALATVSLIRSIGTTIAPAIMVGFLAHAALSLPSNMLRLLPQELNLPTLPYAEELTNQWNDLKKNPLLQATLSTIDIPDLSMFGSIPLNVGEMEQGDLPEDLAAMLKSSDVTTITENTKSLVDRLITERTWDIVNHVDAGFETAKTGINNGLLSMSETLPESETAGITNLATGAIKSLLENTIEKISAIQDAVHSAFDSAKQTLLAQIDQNRDLIEAEFQRTLNVGFRQIYLTVIISSVIALILLGFYKEVPLANTKVDSSYRNHV